MSHRKLNNQQAEFAALVAEGLTATDAYIQVYGGGANRKASSVKAARLMKHPIIAANQARQAAAAISAIDRAVARYGITSESVAEHMARLAFTDLHQIAHWETVRDGKRTVQVLRVRDIPEIDAQALSAISEIRRDAGGALTVKLYNKREALMDIARLKGWIADKPVDNRNLVVLKVER